MHRRELISTLGLTMVSLPFAKNALAAAIADPLAANAKRFAAARKSHNFLAGWESVAPPGTDRVSVKTTGKWPSELRGTLYRNGPGLFDQGGQRYNHWFDGDGLVQSWIIGDAGIHHQSKFVQTSKHVLEQRSGKFEVMAAGTTVPNSRTLSGPDDVNTANISMLQLGGKTYALWEAGSAYQIDPDSLETIGPRAFNSDLDGAPFSAHPVYERDGSIWNFGMFGDSLIVYHVGQDGELIEYKLLKLPRTGYMHSFVASESQLIFVFAPLISDQDRGNYFDNLRWHPELGCLMLVLPKNDLSAPRYADIESGACYHWADAWDEADGSVALRGCWYGENTAFVAPFAPYVQGFTALKKFMQTDLVEIRLAAGAKRASLQKLSYENVEFPIPATLSTRSELLMVASDSKHPLHTPSGLTRISAEGKTLGHYDFGHDFIIEEHLIVRRGKRRFAVGTLFNAKKARTGIQVFDLEHLNDGPLAQAWLERAMPLGFHGTFAST
jgi:all-trans-8'-apo-beta-carotenal 15,15'-oxygenase